MQVGVLYETITPVILPGQTERQRPCHERSLGQGAILLRVESRLAGAGFGLEPVRWLARDNIDDARLRVLAEMRALRPAIHLDMVNRQQVGRVSDHVLRRRVVHVEHHGGIAEKFCVPNSPHRIGVRI